FVGWRPPDSTDTSTRSLLFRMPAGHPSAMVTDPEAFAVSAECGRLASLRGLAERPGVDWWLDPALLDPPMMPVSAEAESADAPSTSDQEDPTTIVEYAPEPHSAQLATVLEENIDERTVLSMPYAQADTVSLRDADAERLAEVVRAHGEQA